MEVCESNSKCENIKECQKDIPNPAKDSHKELNADSKRIVPTTILIATKIKQKMNKGRRWRTWRKQLVN